MSIDMQWWCFSITKRSKNTTYYDLFHPRREYELANGCGGWEDGHSVSILPLDHGSDCAFLGIHAVHNLMGLGVEQTDIETMIKTNPAKLLGLE